MSKYRLENEMTIYDSYDYKVKEKNFGLSLEAHATKEHIDILGQKAQELNRRLVEKEELFILQFLNQEALERLRDLVEKRLIEMEAKDA